MLNFKINWDALGITASLACAIHCAVLPLFFSSAPLFGINLINNTIFEVVMILLALLIGVQSLYHGWKKHHHKTLPLILFMIGIILLLMKQIWHQQQLYFLLPAVAAIVMAHFLNYHFCKRANHCHVNDCDHGKNPS